MTALIELLETWSMIRLWSGVKGVSTSKLCAEQTVPGTRLELSKRYLSCLLVCSLVVLELTPAFLLQALMPVFVQGLERLAEYDYVAIFDADFKPDADFLVSGTLVACTVKVPYTYAQT